eukprot:m.322978 g.322978  ORF g.322978 m.322978 type:complete len:134 (+) comp27616_c0_seq7:112-513(+)
MQKEHLHVSFSAVAADGWQQNASFREQAWRLARFFGRLSQGSLMAYRPQRQSGVPALLIRTSDAERSGFRQWLSQVASGSDTASTNEEQDFGLNLVFTNVIGVHVVEDVSHFSIVTTGACSIAKIIAAARANR